jgi:Flp pilus assembly CpaF family ATPase
MDLPIRAIREQIAGAVDVICQQERMRDGTRKVTAITEVSGMEGDVITMTDIFVFEAAKAHLKKFFILACHRMTILLIRRLRGVI